MRRWLANMKRKGGERTHAKLAGKQVLIWSGEHEAWWRPKCQGYTIYRTYAGVYPFSDAWAATNHCDPSKKICFEVVA